ncbi:small basic protein [Pullulanibacillus pueri]|uniref:Small basic protein n=1 Tax=Pullulanibacillus pueri TaxID=1437324 RepID=A0A8J2ZRL6_9BACL|nr:small basic family protein [Pullulanibacillus pueri]MBM7680139.1 small basic protein [Pullulanibacillus pueri]GGH74541.1 small basic protein [Pullulanibacillus pueri]
MWLPVLGLFIGLVIGWFTNVSIPEAYAHYLSIAILAALDTLFGGMRAHLQKNYDNVVFVSGIFFNIILAAGLAFLGVKLGVDLYLVALFAFGVRLFNNIAIIRRLFIQMWRERAEKNVHKS